MARMKEKLMDILERLTLEQRILLLTGYGYSSEDARDFAEQFEHDTEET